VSRHAAPARHPVILAFVAAVIGLTFTPWPGAPASAGGWAVGSLDAVPVAAAGETELVGFTILQHGVAPADLADDVGIEIVDVDGTADFFPATSDGVPGHFVAAVTFPESSGSYSWAIRMGWFGPQALGTIDVSEPTAGGGGGSPWSAVRWAIAALAVVLATVSVADMATTRRRARARVALG
jgi:hypothetical protein